MKIRFKTFPYLFLWLIVASTVPLVTGCTGEGQALEDDAEKKAKTDGRRGEQERVPVEVVSLERGPIEAVLRFSTHLEAEAEVQVFSQAARLVEELRVEEGDRVREGELLVRLLDDEQRSQLAKVTSQLAKAEREYERQESLFARELISEQAMNDATYELEQLQIAVDDARRELSYTEVRAPISGTVTQRLVNLGDQVTVNQHLFDVVDFDTLVARIYVPEKELPRLAPGQPARLFATSLGASSIDTARAGEIERVAPVVDPQSGTVKVTVGIPENQGLRPGMYVEVELVTAVEDKALLVPKRAVVYDNDRSFLFRLTEEKTAERIEIERLLEDRDVIQPAGSELEAGDRVVVAGQAALKDGTAVRLAGEKRSAEESGAEESGAEKSGAEPGADPGAGAHGG